MATPFVAGVAALTWGANPTLSANVLRNVLTQSAASPANGSDSLGRINAATAIPLAITGNVAPTQRSSIAPTPSPQSFSNSQRIYALGQSENVGQNAESANSADDDSWHSARLENLFAVTQPGIHQQIPALDNEIPDGSAVTTVSAYDQVIAESDWSVLSTLGELNLEETI